MRDFVLGIASSLSAYRLEAILVAATLALLSFLLLLLWLRRADSGPSGEAEETRRRFSFRRIGAWIIRLPSRIFVFFKFLLTPRRWLYRDAWYLLLCEPDGRNEFLEALDAGGRHFVNKRERTLSGACGIWHFYRGCAVIESTAGETDELTEDEAWRTLIHRIQDYRPERPLDGVVLVLPLDLLEQAARPEERSKAQMAMQTYIQRMSEISAQYGFVLPYYVVIKDCEKLDGFEPFLAALDETERGQILGWSRNVQAAVGPGRDQSPIDQGFESIIEATTDRITIISASGVANPDMAHMLMLPREMDKLREGLLILIRPIVDEIRESGVLNLRGVYLAGQAPEESSPSFLTELISGKIGPEANLAVPTHRSVLSSNRRIRWYQFGTSIFVAALLTWLFIDTWSLRDQSESVDDALRLIQKYDGRAYSEQTSVFEILRGMSLMEARPLVRNSMPLSHLRLPGKGVIRYLDDVKLSRVIAPALECELRKRGDELIQDRESRLLPWLNDVSAYLYQLEVFREFTLPGGANYEDSLNDLVDLVEGLYGKPVPDSLFENAQLYEAALSEFEHEIIAGFPHCRGQENTAARLDWKGEFIARAQASSEREFQHAVNDLRKHMGLLQQLEGLIAGQLYTPDFASGLLEFVTWYDQTEASWLNPDHTQRPCESGQLELLRMSSNLDAFDVGRRRDQRDDLRKASAAVDIKPALAYLDPENCSEELAVIRDKHLPMIGAAFSTDAEGRVAFSRAMVSLREVAGTLLQTDFFDAPVTGWWKWSPDYNYQWSPELLQTALDYYAEFENLALDHFGQLVFTTEESTDDIAGHLLSLQQLKVAMHSAVRAAQISAVPDSEVEPIKRPIDVREVVLSSRVADFSESLETLLRIDSIYQRLGLVDAHEQLLQAVSGYAVALLEDVDTLALDGELYALSENPSWSANSVMTGAFRKSNEQLPGWLKVQRRRANHIALKYAAPLVTYLMNVDPGYYRANYRLFETWLATVTEAHAMNKGAGSGTVQALEDYISATLAGVSWADCSTLSESAQPPTLATDLFTAANARIRGDVAGLCRAFHNQSTLDVYQLLAENFNGTLRNRYPFVGQDHQNEGDASLSDVKRFFRQYSNWRPGLKSQLEDMGGKPGYAAAADFLASMDEVAQLFRSGVEANVPLREAGIGLTVRFRSSFPLSDYAANIKRWRVHSGAYTMSSPGQAGEFIWQFGQPFEVSLSWSSTGPVTPVRGLPQYHVADVHDGTAYYRDNTTWSLMRFVDRHRSVLPDLSVDDRDVVLNFITPLKAAGDATVDSDAMSNAFIRLGVYSRDPQDGSQKIMSWPSEFPAYAPLLPGASVAALD